MFYEYLYLPPKLTLWNALIILSIERPTDRHSITWNNLRTLRHYVETSYPIIIKSCSLPGRANLIPRRYDICSFDDCVHNVMYGICIFLLFYVNSIIDRHLMLQD